MPGVGKEDLDDPQNLLVEGYISRAEANEAVKTKKKVCMLLNSWSSSPVDNFDSVSRRKDFLLP